MRSVPTGLTSFCTIPHVAIRSASPRMFPYGAMGLDSHGLSGVGLRDGLLVVFPRICLWDWSFIVFSLSGEDHIDTGSFSLSSVEAQTQAGLPGSCS